MIRPTYIDGSWSQYATEHDLPLETPGGGGTMTNAIQKLYIAWAEITGKVFVERDELLEKLAELYPEQVRWDSEEAEWIDVSSEADKAFACRAIAEGKLRELFRTDEPLKLYELKVDDF